MATATAARANKAVKQTAKKAAAKKAPAKKALPAAQKTAMQKGRAEASIVKQYLTALDRTKRRGRQVSAEELQARIDALNVEITEAPAGQRVYLVQKRLDLEDRLDGSQGDDIDIEALEADFIRVAAEFGSRKGITRKAFREVGVPAAVLKDAGVRG